MHSNYFSSRTAPDLKISVDDMQNLAEHLKITLQIEIEL